MPKMNETDLMHLVMLEVSKAGHRIFRTNVGKVRMADGRWFDTGLPKGYPDLCGYCNDGTALYIETKVKPYKPTEAQCRFLLLAINKGCNAGVAFSVEQAMDIAEGNLREKAAQQDYLKRRLEECTKVKRS